MQLVGLLPAHLHLLDANRRLEQLTTLGPLQASTAAVVLLLLLPVLRVLLLLLLLRVLPPLAGSPLKPAQAAAAGGARQRSRPAGEAGQVDGCLAAPLLAIHVQRRDDLAEPVAQLLHLQQRQRGVVGSERVGGGGGGGGRWRKAAVQQ